jgi:diphthamide synthase (EF-2-diphthine--ammonia ligase)
MKEPLLVARSSEYREENLARVGMNLPGNADPRGENREFHSFVSDGPIFSEPVRFQRGEVMLREERFSFCDLLPYRADLPGR